MFPAPLGNSYDEVPYESHPYPQSHPGRLAVVATLFGAKPPPVHTCRVLELGSAAGGNIIPIAEMYPDSWCVGIDLSARQISDGEQVVHRLGLKNISLRHASITDVDESYGRFDYIICHGVFSWVPASVRDAIFAICRQNLTPNGVAYVSYNTYPGWHMRGMIRDMMRYHAVRFDTPEQRTQQARALLDFLAGSVRREGPYAALLKSELESIRKQTDQYLYHEHLEDVNDPVYFHQFIDLARAHHLRYLGESRIGTMVTGNFGPDVEKALKLLGNDQIQSEQYMDFLRNRTFRETLLVREEVEPDWSIRPEHVRPLHVASGGKPVGPAAPDGASKVSVQFQSPGGITVSTSQPLLKAALRILRERWPATVSFQELSRAARAAVGETADASQEDDEKSLALGLVNIYISSDLVELHAAGIPAVRAAGERPVAAASARERARSGGSGVTNLRHEVVHLTEFPYQLLPHLDGTRDRAQLLDRVVEMAAAGDLQVQKDGQAVSDLVELRAGLATVLDQALADLAARSLLVG